MNAKKAYNDKYVGQAGKISGNRWYEIQAFRAINQALGRCLRHRNDWGAILLVDSRWQTERTRADVSKWLRKLMRSHRDDISPDPTMDSHPYDNFLDTLGEFISKNQSKYDELLQHSQESYRNINLV